MTDRIHRNLSKTHNTPELPDGSIRGIISGTVSCGVKMYQMTRNFDTVYNYVGVKMGSNVLQK